MGWNWHPRGSFNLVPWPLRKFIGYKINWTKKGATSRSFYIGLKDARYTKNSKGTASFDGPGLLNFKKNIDNGAVGGIFPLLAGLVVVAGLVLISYWLRGGW